MRLFVAILILTSSMVGYFRTQIHDIWFKQTHGGLLNFDYGIVSVEDLKYEDRHSSSPRPRHKGYHYWQCFRAEQLKVWCEPSEPRDQRDIRFHLVITAGRESHIYDLNKAVDAYVCEELVIEIANVTKDQKHFCINGKNFDTVSTPNSTEYLWDFYRLKTKNGYAHYVYTDDMPR